MTTVPKSWVYAAAGLLAATALGSLVLGATRGGPGRDAISDTGALAPVPDAAAAKPIADLTAEDAHFRQIAREEAQAALAKSAPKPKPVAKPADDKDDDTPSSSSSSGTAAEPVASTPAHTPTAAKPPAPLSAAAAAGQRALIGGGSSSHSGTSNPYPPGSSPD